MSNFFVHFPTEEIETENKLLFEPIESPYAKRIKGTINMYERVSKSVCDTIKQNWFPVVLSGDHSTAGATIAGLKLARPKAKLGVIWIDAHADLHTPSPRLPATCTACRWPLPSRKTTSRTRCMKSMRIPSSFGDN